MVDDESLFAKYFLDVLSIGLTDAVVFEEMGGVALDLDRFISDEFMVDGEGRDIFAGAGDFGGKIKFGGNNPAGDGGTVGDTFIFFVLG